MARRCLSALAPDANFARRYVALQSLHLLADVDALADVASDAAAATSLASLVDCLSDSFEANRQMALRLLLRSPALRRSARATPHLLDHHRSHALRLAQVNPFFSTEHRFSAIFLLKSDFLFDAAEFPTGRHVERRLRPALDRRTG